jgi:hypothetical protein
MKNLTQNSEFDKLIREKLSNVEVPPSGHLWDKVLPVIPKYNPWGQVVTPFTKIFIGSLTFVGAVLISTISIVNNQGGMKTATPAFDEKNTEAFVEVADEIVRREETSVESIQTMIPKFSKVVTSGSQSSYTPEQLSEFHNYDLSSHELSEQTVSQAQPKAEHEINMAEMPVKIPTLAYEFTMQSTLDLPSKQNTSEFPPDYINNSELSLNLSMHPEVFYFDPSLFNPRKSKDYSIGVTLMYSTGDIFFETGIAGTHVSQINLYQNTTITNELVSQYEQVDSVQFVQVWDPVLQTYITQPVFFTSLVNIYEQQTETELQNKDDSYIYLQIPVLVGLSKSVKRFTLEAKTGFVFTSLIYTSQQNKSYSNDELQIVLAEQTLLSLNRSRQYWSFMLGVGGSFKLTNGSSLFLTPTYRYLLNPLYSGNQPSRKTPWAFGVQTGLRITF